MDGQAARRDTLRGIGLLLSGIVTLALIIALVVQPTLFRTAHPLPLLVLLVVATVVSFWSAAEIFR